MGGTLLPLGALAAIGGIAVLRRAWALGQRSAAANAAGWLLLGLAVVAGGAAEGAWGIAVVSLVAMAAAAVLLGWSAATAPTGRTSASNRRVKMLPEAGEPLRLGARVLTFALVGIAGLASSIALAIGLRGLALVAGWSEADANATALFAVPFVWGVLATVLLMQQSRRAQIATLAIASAPLVPVLLTGS